MPRAECFWNQDMPPGTSAAAPDILSQGLGQVLNHHSTGLIPTNKGVEQYSSPKTWIWTSGHINQKQFSLLVVMGAVPRHGFAFRYSETFCVALAESHWDSCLIVSMLSFCLTWTVRWYLYIYTHSTIVYNWVWYAVHCGLCWWLTMPGNYRPKALTNHSLIVAP